MNDQLAAIRELHDLFGRAGIPYWLFGGWGVDFHVGRVTRPHDDVDLAVRGEDVPRVAELLEAEGWRHAPDPDEHGGTAYERGGIRLELTYVASGWPWPDDALSSEPRELAGVRASVLGRVTLAAGKSRPRDDPGEAAKDRADFEALSG